MQEQADNFAAREVAESMGLTTSNLPWLGGSSGCCSFLNDWFRVCKGMCSSFQQLKKCFQIVKITEDENLFTVLIISESPEEIVNPGETDAAEK